MDPETRLYLFGRGNIRYASDASFISRFGAEPVSFWSPFNTFKTVLSIEKKTMYNSEIEPCCDENLV